MMAPLFPLPDAVNEPKVSDSSDVRRRKKAERMIAGGQHPFGPSLRELQGETCGSCAHAERQGHGQRAWWKCPLVGGVTNGPGTDLRLKWPACSQWEPKP